MATVQVSLVSLTNPFNVAVTGEVRLASNRWLVDTFELSGSAPTYTPKVPLIAPHGDSFIVEFTLIPETA